MPTKSGLLLGLGLLAVLAPPVYAGWIEYPEADLRVCTAPGWQAFPQSVQDGAGGVIIVYADLRQRKPARRLHLPIASGRP